MLMIILSIPICLLSFFLAFLCYRRAHYQHTLILVIIGLLLLCFSVGMIIAGYFTNQVIQQETTATENLRFYFDT